MFNSISGEVTGKSEDALFVTTGGIEWEIFVPLTVLKTFDTAGAKVKIYTWLLHREDQLKVFGFSSEKDRLIFLDLIKVDGIGPKQAIKILSGMPASALEAALDEEDVDKLQSVPGIGKKTAQKMILALKGKLTALNSEPSKAKSAASEFEDLVIALNEMGFDRKASAEKLSELASEFRSHGKDPASYEQELFRLAIINLS